VEACALLPPTPNTQEVGKRTHLHSTRPPQTRTRARTHARTHQQTHLDNHNAVRILHCGEAVSDDQDSAIVHGPVQRFLNNGLQIIDDKLSNSKKGSWVGRGLQSPLLLELAGNTSTVDAPLPPETHTSLSASKAEVASSKSSTVGRRTRALAMAMRCFCPPLNCTPRSPHSVCSKIEMKQ
jgi:hypothetical protein